MDEGRDGTRQGRAALSADASADGRGAAAHDARSLDDASRVTIEDRLRSMFEEVANEPVPDRFLDLLDKLERAETRAPARGEDG